MPAGTRCALATTGGFFAELRRRNVIRAAVLYVGAAWALAQGIAQLGPSVGAPEWVTRAFLVAAAIGLPFWIAFSWFYAWTRDGLKRESELPADGTLTHSAGRKLDFAIIGVLSVAVVLLLTNTLMSRREMSSGAPTTAGTSSPSVTANPAPARASTPSIAVLPLANAGGDADQQYFSDGLTENLITALSQFGGLKVISRNSAFQFRDSGDSSRVIGEKLGVAHLLEGSVRRLGDTVRIHATLVLASDGSTVWSERYDRPYKDLFKLQDDITAAVATALKARLVRPPRAAAQSDRPPSGNLDAYNAYLQGQYYAARRTQEDFRRAFGYFERATRRDPRYARAWAAYASAVILDGAIFLGGSERQAAAIKARGLIDRALALAPDSGYVHASDSRVMSNGELRFVDSEAAARRAVELEPTSDSLGELALGRTMLGDPLGAEALMRRALELDPLNGAVLFWRSVNFGGLGRLDDAQRTVDRAIELTPGAAIGRAQRVAIEVLRGHRDKALAYVADVPDGNWRLIANAMASQGGPDPAQGDRALQALVEDRGSAAYQIAQVYALRRDPDQVFHWLETAWVIRDPGLRRLLTDPFIAPYRSDPRFAAFCRRIGLPPPGPLAARPATAKP